MSLRFESTLASIRQFLATQTDPVTAMRTSYGILQQMLDQQAQLWSYVDEFSIDGGGLFRLRSHRLGP